ncbi:hypothetical protein FB45DRAFT_672219, partial [Roridomyces roridus]
ANLPRESELDKLFVRTLESGKDKDKKRRAIYGPVLSNPSPLKLVVHGVCRHAGKANAKAAAAVFGGTNSRHNRGRPVHGKQTSARAELTAILLALTCTPGDRTLEVSTRSDYVVRSIAHNAAENQACGWRCQNGDILSSILECIRARTAPIHLLWI